MWQILYPHVMVQVREAIFVNFVINLLFLKQREATKTAVLALAPDPCPAGHFWDK